MSKLEQLIAELCPDGVKYVRLDDICESKRGQSITKKDIFEGYIPVVAGGQAPAYYHNLANRSGDTVALAGSGAYAGFVSYWDIPVFLSDSFSVDPDEKILDSKYLFHFLKSRQEIIYGMQKGGGVPHVYGKDVLNLRIPLPPLEIQREIVRILDKFTELTAELIAELTARKKQYEYYRNDLLSFGDAVPMVTLGEVGYTLAHCNAPNLDRLIAELCPDGVKYVPLSEVFIMRNGYTPSKANKNFWECGTLPWFRMEDIRINGHILSDSIQHITPEAVKGKLFPANSIIMATTATIGEHALLLVDSLANQRFTFFTKNVNCLTELKLDLDIMFAYHYFFILCEWCKLNTNISSFPSVDMGKLKNYLFPLPPLEIQREIVRILDKFDALTTDISNGLPAEINARKKQYEYYRDKLLSFKEVGT